MSSFLDEENPRQILAAKKRSQKVLAFTRYNGNIEIAQMTTSPISRPAPAGFLMSNTLLLKTRKQSAFESSICDNIHQNDP